MLFEAILEFDNKTAHCLTPVLNWHRPFLAGIFNRKVNHFSCRIITREGFPFLDGFSDDAVERLNRVGCVDGLAYIFRIIEQCIQVLPVVTP